jgi:hypothetical protein
VWTNATITPLERPASMKGKAFLTPAEAGALEEQAARRREEADKPIPGRFESYNQFWLDGGTTVLSTRQTSLVVDPPDGRVPVRPEAERSRDYHFEHYGDQPEHMSPWDRCITRGMPGGMLPAGYNNAYQIMQFPGYVVILYEMIHEARIIPVDGRPAPPPHVRSSRAAAGRATRSSSRRRTTTTWGGSRPARPAAASRASGTPTACTSSNASSALPPTRSVTQRPSSIRRFTPRRGQWRSR